MVDNLIVRTGEDRVKRFLRTLSKQEKIELIEEVKRMIELKTLDLDKFENKPSVEFTYFEDY